MNMLSIGFGGPSELIVIGLIVVLLFGAKKLPELARSMGSSVTQFKKGLKEGGGDDAEAKRLSGAAEAEAEQIRAQERAADKEQTGETR